MLWGDLSALRWPKWEGYTSPPFWISFPLGHHRALSKLPCDIQLDLISYLFIHNRVYMSIPTSQFTPPFPHTGTGIYAFVLYSHVSISVLQVSLSVPFF